MGSLEHRDIFLEFFQKIVSWTLEIFCHLSAAACLQFYVILSIRLINPLINSLFEAQPLSELEYSFPPFLYVFFVVKLLFASDAVLRTINNRLLNVERAFINLEPILQDNPLQR